MIENKQVYKSFKASANIQTAQAPVSPGGRSIELLMGEEVLQLLDDTRFLGRWDHLFNTCPWATVFQSRSFVATWYRVYGKEFFPILLKTEQAGQLTGLLTLAGDKNGLITGAGANQAEYQAWLTTDVNDEQFIKNALQEVRRFFPGKKVLLKYIPAGVPLGFTKKDPLWNKRCFVKESPQPLMIINDTHLTNELRKKNRREKINRLKRLGDLKFERIIDHATFNAVFDELAIQSDFRKGAMYNKIAFKTDPLRKKFLLGLFEKNNLHVTVLKLNEKIIASNVSIGGQRQLHLQGLNSFDAAFARHSPGIIHFLMLGKLLVEECVEVFDLTPGADGYKETLATDYSVAYTLSIGNHYHNFKNRFTSALNRYLKKTAAMAGVKQDAIKKWQRTINLHKGKWKNVMQHGLSSSIDYVLHKLKRQKTKTTCWEVQKEVTCSGYGQVSIQKDNYNNLLHFDSREIRYSQQEFLANAMHRFEEGEHCSTWVEGETLLGCAWVTNLKPTVYESVYSGKIEGWIISLPELYCHPEGRKRYTDFLQTVATEVAVDSPHNRFYIVTDCDAEREFEKAGFRPQKL